MGVRFNHLRLRIFERKIGGSHLVYNEAACSDVSTLKFGIILSMHRVGNSHSPHRDTLRIGPSFGHAGCR